MINMMRKDDDHHEHGENGDDCVDVIVKITLPIADVKNDNDKSMFQLQRGGVQKIMPKPEESSVKMLPSCHYIRLRRIIILKVSKFCT